LNDSGPEGASRGVFRLSPEWAETAVRKMQALRPSQAQSGRKL